MTGRWLVAIALIGCGDNRPGGDDPFTAVSGTRLALQKYRYDDGTELTATGEFYDTQLHTRCTPAPWRDASLRCVPVADDAEYLDPACTMPIGLGRTIARPTFFVAGDPVAGGAATRVFRAGAAVAPIAQYYSVVGGACVGPIPIPAGLTSFFAIGDELDGDALVGFHDDELAGDRLGLALRETDDGLRVAYGLRDRTLGAACTATVQGDGRVVCEPAGAAAASYFLDPACTAPAIAVAGVAPAIARVIEPSGCASYHPLAGEVAAPVYRRDGDTCVAAAAPDGRLFALDAALALPELERSLEDVPDRRLRRVILAHGGLRLFDDRLFDTATGADCRPRTLRDAIRCLPATAVAATTLFTDGCMVAVRVAELPRRTCEPIGYATTNRPFQLRAIGDVVAAPMFRFDGATCQAYAGSSGTQLRALGPPLDLTTFPSAIYFGER